MQKMVEKILDNWLKRFDALPKFLFFGWCIKIQKYLSLVKSTNLMLHYPRVKVEGWLELFKFEKQFNPEVSLIHLQLKNNWAIFHFAFFDH